MDTYKKLGTFYQRDIFPQMEDTPCDFEDRVTGKSIITNERGGVALVGTAVNYIYTLPGGGVDAGESIEEGICREAKEETGYDTEWVRKIGVIDDFRNRDKKHCISYCALLKATSEVQELNLTDDEKKNGLHVKWFGLEDAKKVLSEENEQVKKGEISFYNTAFNVVRDYEFLKEYQKTI